jgi:6-phosphofructokinase 1
MGIGIFCSGGDCAGMNPAIRKFVDRCFDRNIQPYLIYDGLEGMIDGHIKKATHKDVSGIISKGGTMIRSSRSKRFYEKKYREQALNQLKNNDIDKLVVLGGDGSFRALNQFYNDFEVKFVGIPSTIDNDIYSTEYCLGVDTALNVIRSAIDNIRDTASSFRRAFVIEVMGRSCGYLALVSAITSGAEVCIIPEIDHNLSVLKDRLSKELELGRGYILAIVAEGTNKTECVKHWLEDDLKIDSRVSILGHIQRGGNPTVYDRLMGFEFVEQGLKVMLDKNINNSIIAYRKGAFHAESIDTVVSNKYEIKTELLSLAYKMSGVSNKIF